MRSTPWGPLPVSDSHVHFFSHRFFDLLCRQKPGLEPEAAIASLGWQPPPDAPEMFAQQWIAELDRHGVGHASLIASLPGDESSVVAAVRAFPDRFRAYAMVNPCGEAASATSELLAAGAIQGVCLFPAMHRYSLHDERAEALMGAAASAGAAIFVHCGILSVGVRKRLGLPSHFDLRYSNPIDLQSIASRLGNARFILPHFGAGYFSRGAHAVWSMSECLARHFEQQSLDDL